MSARRVLLEDWLKAVLDLSEINMTPASGDASFRHYWRLALDGQTLIAMDAPPETEDTERFARIAGDWRALGLRTPAIYARDVNQGFVLLEDFGRRHYLDALHEASADRLYGDALGALAIIQACAPSADLPAYDAPFLRRELDLFRHWLVERYLGLTLSSDEEADVEEGLALLIASALEQPQVCVHRDFHSRNLMITPSPSPGILDFQDAVAGPVTYDLVSLLRDCYIAWPRARVEEWAWGYFGLAVQSGILRLEQEVDFLRWFDLMGVQRHLKASGIFARLLIRDGKPGYLGDIPRTLNYVLEVAPAYAPLRGLAALIAGRVLPALRMVTRRATTT